MEIINRSLDAWKEEKKTVAFYAWKDGKTVALSVAPSVKEETTTEKKTVALPFRKESVISAFGDTLVTTTKTETTEKGETVINSETVYSPLFSSDSWCNGLKVVSPVVRHVSGFSVADVKNMKNPENMLLATILPPDDFRATKPSTSIPTHAEETVKLTEEEKKTVALPVNEYAIVNVGDRIPHINKDGSISEHKKDYNGSMATERYITGRSINEIREKEKLTKKYMAIPKSIIEHSFLLSSSRADSDMEKRPDDFRAKEIWYDFMRVKGIVFRWLEYKNPVILTSESIRREYFRDGEQYILGDNTITEEIARAETIDDVILKSVVTMAIDSYELFSATYTGMLSAQNDGESEYKIRLSGYKGVNKHVNGERANSNATTDEYRIDDDGEIINVETELRMTLFHGYVTYIDGDDDGEDNRTEEQKKKDDLKNRRYYTMKKALQKIRKEGLIEKDDLKLFYDVANGRETMDEIAKKYGYKEKSVVSRKSYKIRKIILSEMAQQDIKLNDDKQLQKMLKEIAEKQERRRATKRAYKERKRAEQKEKTTV